MVTRCPEKPLRRTAVTLRRQQPAKVMTVDEDSGALLLPKTYVTRRGRLVLYADDPLVDEMQSFDQDTAAARDAYVDKLLQDTFNGNLLYLAASILVFGDDVRNVTYKVVQEVTPRHIFKNVRLICFALTEKNKQ